MKISNVDYTTFWSLVSSKGLLAQYTDTNNAYVVFAAEEAITWETTVLKDGGANQTDFETNHKASANQPCANTTSGSGTITALNGAVTSIVQGSSTVIFNVTGTWVGNLAIEATADGVNWFTTQGLLEPSSILVEATPVNNTIVINSAAFFQIRLRASAWTSGTANISWSAGIGSNIMWVYNPTPSALNVQAQGNVAAGIADSGAPVKTGGVYNSTLPTLSNGQRGDTQIDLNGRHIITLSTRPTYMAASASFTPAATPTDVFTIVGSASKTVKVWRIEISSNQTVAGTNNWFLIKRSAADTGGTKTTLTNGPVDSTNAAATATVSNYTANPTSLGASVATLLVQRIVAPASGALWNQTNVLYDADECIYPQPITLRSTSEVLAVNFNGAALPSGLTVNFSIVWTEE